MLGECFWSVIGRFRGLPFPKFSRGADGNTVDPPPWQKLYCTPNGSPLLIFSFSQSFQQFVARTSVAVDIFSTLTITFLSQVLWLSRCLRWQVTARLPDLYLLLVLFSLSSPSLNVTTSPLLQICPFSLREPMILDVQKRVFSCGRIPPSPFL